MAEVLARSFEQDLLHGLVKSYILDYSSRTSFCMLYAIKSGSAKAFNLILQRIDFAITSMRATVQTACITCIADAHTVDEQYCIWYQTRKQEIEKTCQLAQNVVYHNHKRTDRRSLDEVYSQPGNWNLESF